MTEALAEPMQNLPVPQPRMRTQIILIALGLFAALLVITATVKAADGIVTPEEFWQLVADTQVSVDRTANPSDFAALAGRWEALKGIQTKSGAVAQIDTSFVTAQLTADPSDLERLSAYLAGLQAARDQWPQQQLDPTNLTRLQAILARDEFQWQAAEPGFWEKLLDRVIRFVLNLLEKLLNLGTNAGSMVPGWVSISLVAAIIAAILVFALRGFLKNSVPDAEWKQDAEQMELLSADGALARAQQLSGEGDFRQAVRYLYLSALLLLDEHGLLRYDRTQTNREYLRQVSRDPELTGQLRAVIELFDRVWYGFQPVDAATYADYARRIQWLRESRK